MSTVNKAIKLLDLIAQSEKTLRFSELEKASGMPKATVHRLLAELTAERLIRLDSHSRTYKPGLRLLELAHRSWESLDLRTVAADDVDELSRQTGETVHLAVLDSSSIVYVDKRESTSSLRLFSAIGKRGPLYCTGLGKAILAHVGSDECERVLADQDRPAHTPHTLTERAALVAELAQIRHRGCAFDREEHEQGIRCVAAPIFDGSGSAVAGISVTAPSVRMDDARMEALCPLVIAAAKSISQHLRLLH